MRPPPCMPNKFPATFTDVRDVLILRPSEMYVAPSGPIRLFARLSTNSSWQLRIARPIHRAPCCPRPLDEKSTDSRLLHFGRASAIARAPSSPILLHDTSRCFRYLADRRWVARHVAPFGLGEFASVKEREGVAHTVLVWIHLVTSASVGVDGGVARRARAQVKVVNNTIVVAVRLDLAKGVIGLCA